MGMEIEEIQPGWRVVDANGEEVGTVTQTGGSELTVKKSGFLGGEVHVPIDAVADVETGRVEINRSKGDLG
jgi:hypothetical protein